MNKNYYYDTGIEVSNEFADNLRALIQNSRPDQWMVIIEMDLLPVPLSLFESEPLLMKIIKNFNCGNKIAIFRTQPNTSYHWHVDKSRNACLNLLIDGWKSMCFYAEPRVNGMRSNLTLLPYEENKIFLLNVEKNHTVLNFDNMRYMLSIGFPRPTTFNQVKKFINEEGQTSRRRRRKQES